MKDKIVLLNWFCLWCVELNRDDNQLYENKIDYEYENQLCVQKKLLYTQGNQFFIFRCIRSENLLYTWDNHWYWLKYIIFYQIFQFFKNNTLHVLHLDRWND